MGNLKTKNTKEEPTEHISIRAPKDLKVRLVQLTANRMKESGEVESFTETVLTALQAGIDTLELNKKTA